MIIKSIDLENYRNYSLLSLDFDKDTNILYGDNAQGKTNILEAIYVSGTTKSHRGSKDQEILSFGKDESHIKTIVQKKGIDYRIDMHIKKNIAKGIAINGIPIKKSIDLYGIINIVFFSPEDLNIIKNGPSFRRKFMDMELCQLDKVYAHDLINYNRIIMQRNKLLKDLYFNSSLSDNLDVWDMQLVDYGCRIIKRRREFVDSLNSIIYNIHSNLSGGKEHLNVQYEMCTDEQVFEKQLKDSRDRDIKFKLTNVGPHRDDISFYNDEIDIRRFGSQGQQRTTALSLKLAEIELVKHAINDTPILLLDDVLSELDGGRQNYLLNSISDVQTLITCTGLDEFIKNRFNINKIFKVSNGTVTCEN